MNSEKLIVDVKGHPWSFVHYQASLEPRNMDVYDKWSLLFLHQKLQIPVSSDGFQKHPFPISHESQSGAGVRSMVRK